MSWGRNLFVEMRREAPGLARVWWTGLGRTWRRSQSTTESVWKSAENMKRRIEQKSNTAPRMGTDTYVFAYRIYIMLNETNDGSAMTRRYQRAATQSSR